MGYPPTIAKQNVKKTLNVSFSWSSKMFATWKQVIKESKVTTTRYGVQKFAQVFGSDVKNELWKSEIVYNFLTRLHIFANYYILF